MTAKDYGWQVGMTVYVVPHHGRPYEATVTSVGRKWVHISDGAWRKERFDPEFNRRDTPYGLGADIYPNREEYERQSALEQAWRDLYATFRKIYSLPKGMTLAKIEQIKALLAEAPE